MTIVLSYSFVLSISEEKKFRLEPSQYPDIGYCRYQQVDKDGADDKEVEEDPHLGCRIGNHACISQFYVSSVFGDFKAHDKDHGKGEDVDEGKKGEGVGDTDTGQTEKNSGYGGEEAGSDHGHAVILVEALIIEGKNQPDGYGDDIEEGIQISGDTMLVCPDDDFKLCLDDVLVVCR